MTGEWSVGLTAVAPVTENLYKCGSDTELYPSVAMSVAMALHLQGEVNLDAHVSLRRIRDCARYDGNSMHLLLPRWLI